MTIINKEFIDSLYSLTVDELWAAIQNLRAEGFVEKKDFDLLMDGEEKGLSILHFINSTIMYKEKAGKVIVSGRWQYPDTYYWKVKDEKMCKMREIILEYWQSHDTMEDR